MSENHLLLEQEKTTLTPKTKVSVPAKDGYIFNILKVKNYKKGHKSPEKKQLQVRKRSKNKEAYSSSHNEMSFVSPVSQAEGKIAEAWKDYSSCLYFYND